MSERYGPTREDDLRDLMALECIARHGRQAAMQRFGQTRGQIAGFLNRTVRASDREGCQCQRADNRDGGMPDRWWLGCDT